MANTICKINDQRSACNICNRLVFNRGTDSEMTVCGEHLISLNLVELMNSSDGIAIGAACSNSLMVNMIVPRELAFATATIEPIATIDDIDIPLGKFYVCNSTTENNYKTVNLECYDGFCKTEESYVPTIEFPGLIEDVVNDIADQCGFEVSYDFSAYEAMELPWCGDFTCRQMLGYIAGLMGTNAHFGRDGKLSFVWYTDSDITIERERQHLNQFKILKTDTFRIDSLVSGVEENQIKSGDGMGITFENPYITETSQLDEIFEKVGGTEFQPCYVKYRGDLNILPGTCIKIKNQLNEDVRACVMEHNLLLNGGLAAEIHSYGQEEINYSFSSADSFKTLTGLASRMDRAVMMTKGINNSKGGVFQIIDEDGDGTNDSFVIRMAGETGNYIKGNVDGIGFSNDGGKNYTTAINHTGICAKAIDTMELLVGQKDMTLSDVLNVKNDDYEGMVLVLGSGVNNVIMQQENDQIAFYEKESYESGSREALCSFGVQTNTGKKLIKLGNLSIESWSNGNVTFSTGGVK